MDQAVDGGDGHAFVWEDGVPVFEGLVAGDDQGSPLISLGDEFEEHAGFGLIFSDVAEIIQDEALVPIELGQGGRQFEIAASRLQVLHQIGRAGIEDRVSPINEAMPDGGREVRLADAAGAEDQQVAAGVDPSIARGQRIEMGRFQTGDEIRREAAQRFPRWKTRRVSPRGGAALITFGRFVFEQCLQEALMAPVGSGGLVAVLFPQTSDGGEAQGAQQRRNNGFGSGGSGSGSSGGHTSISSGAVAHVVQKRSS